MSHSCQFWQRGAARFGRRFLLFSALVAFAGAALAESPLPPLLKTNGGAMVTTSNDWRSVRRAEVAAAILPVEYGHLPAVPKNLKVDEVSTCGTVRWLTTISFRTLRVSTDMDGIPVSFALEIWAPKSAKNAKLPVLLVGDGCWQNLSEKIIAAVIARRWMVARFNRCEVAVDEVPSKDSTLLKWAWAYHRAIDALERAEPRAGKIAITGHSRGGKTVELAGATDERIFAVGDNCSGCGGSAPCRNAPPTAENVEKITRVFPYWFDPGWKNWAGREDELAFDQHFLLALIAPRKLFVRHAKRDLWANPEGAKGVVEAASEVWRLYGAEKNIAYSLREGEHSHLYEDYMAFLDFVEQ